MRTARLIILLSRGEYTVCCNLSNMPDTFSLSTNPTKLLLRTFLTPNLKKRSCRPLNTFHLTVYAEPPVWRKPPDEAEVALFTQSKDTSLATFENLLS